MKIIHIAFIVLLSSCALIDTAKKAITGSYEIGKTVGRQEVLELLENNKKKVNQISYLLTTEIYDKNLSSPGTTVLIALNLVKVLEERKKLIEKIKPVKKRRCSTLGICR